MKIKNLSNFNFVTRTLVLKDLAPLLESNFYEVFLIFLEFYKIESLNEEAPILTKELAEDFDNRVVARCWKFAISDFLSERKFYWFSSLSKTDFDFLIPNIDKLLAEITLDNSSYNLLDMLTVNYRAKLERGLKTIPKRKFSIYEYSVNTLLSWGSKIIQWRDKYASSISDKNPRKAEIVDKYFAGLVESNKKKWFATTPVLDNRIVKYSERYLEVQFLFENKVTLNSELFASLFFSLIYLSEFQKIGPFRVTLITASSDGTFFTLGKSFLFTDDTTLKQFLEYYLNATFNLVDRGYETYEIDLFIMKCSKINK